MKKYKISLNFSQIIDAKDEEGAKEQFRECLDNTFFKLDVEEL